MVTAAAVVGSLLPDFSLYFMFFWNRWVRGMSERQIFGTEYFSDYWQRVFSIDNSIPLWGAVLAVGLAARAPVIAVFAAAGLMHLVLDLALHHDDGRAHFWPISEWKFESPVSYWDPRHYGDIVGPVEIGICAVMLIALWRRFPSVVARVLILLVGLLEILPGLLFRLL